MPKKQPRQPVEDSVTDHPAILKVDTKEIKNKTLREKIALKQRLMKEKLRKGRVKERNELGLEKQQPITQEMRRERDDTIPQAEAEFNEVAEEQDCDEFESYFQSDTNPKILVTTGLDGFRLERNPPRLHMRFVTDLVKIIPNAFFLKRKAQYSIGEIVEYAKKREFTDLLVLGHRISKPYSMIHIHLPEGPTAFYRISGVKYHKNLDPKRRTKMTPLRVQADKTPPELIMNNFTTRLGMRIGRMLQTMFPKMPAFKARRLVTFHNQRDFVFFRHHMYQFIENGKEVILNEIGPRFTLRLQKMQIGTFNVKFGEFEWFFKQRMETSRRKWFL